MRIVLRIGVLSIMTLVWMGCETSDRMLYATERAIGSRTGKTVIDLIEGKDPSQVAKHRLDEYAKDPERLLQDLRAAQRDFKSLFVSLGGKVGEKWGKKEVKLPQQKKYVKYTQNYKSRAIVDFDSGEILVETLDEQDPRHSLRNAIVTTLLTPQDPRAVDLFSDKEIPLNADQEPYLFGLIVDQHGQSIRTPTEAEAFTDYLLEHKTATRVVEQNGIKKTSTFTSMKMVANLPQKQAEKYRPMVTQFAQRYNISPSLVFAIIRTESNFNPYAVSSAPAYGLMQLVPNSGGREAYKRAKGKDVIPSRDYLFNPTNNIELGTAYLSVLTFHQLEEITNTVSREYCVISAYNTGPHNVFRAFSKDTTAALDQINGLQPSGVYEHLQQHLPYQETRRYLEKVTASRKEFVTSSDTVVR